MYSDAIWSSGSPARYGCRVPARNASIAATMSLDPPRAATLAGGAIILRELTRVVGLPFQLGAGGLREGAVARLLAARQAA